jgi:ribulose-phosphate 3-epimerase
MPIRIIPSVLAADFGHLQAEVDSIEAHADGIQIDVMDGHFVPNLSLGAPVAKCIRTKLPLDIHLMVSNPAERIAEFLAFGVAQVTFHAEAVEDSNSRKALIKAIRNGGASAGIAVNPATSLASIEDVLEDIDLVLVMTIVPGFSGQAFLPETLEKVRTLRTRFPELRIQVDGGINAETARLAREAGATELVAATSIFGSSDRASAISSLRS